MHHRVSLPLSLSIPQTRRLSSYEPPEPMCYRYVRFGKLNLLAVRCYLVDLIDIDSVVSSTARRNCVYLGRDVLINLNLSVLPVLVCCTPSIAKTISLPGPPFIVSSPVPPISPFQPPRPRSVSLPPLPTIWSTIWALFVPVSWSAVLVPLIAQTGRSRISFGGRIPGLFGSGLPVFGLL